MRLFFLSIFVSQILVICIFTLVASSSAKEIEPDSVIRVVCCVDKFCVIFCSVCDCRILDHISEFFDSGKKSL